VTRLSPRVAVVPDKRFGAYLPSLESSDFRVAPRFARAKDGVQGDDQLSHDGGDNNFAGLAIPSEFIGEEAHDGIVLDGDERRHVERLADGRSPCLDMAKALERAAIVVDWRQARDAGGVALCA
jgi:hypothetical protein